MTPSFQSPCTKTDLGMRSTSTFVYRFASNKMGKWWCDRICKSPWNKTGMLSVSCFTHSIVGGGRSFKRTFFEHKSCSKLHELRNDASGWGLKQPHRLSSTFFSCQFLEHPQNEMFPKGRWKQNSCLVHCWLAIALLPSNTSQTVGVEYRIKQNDFTTSVLNWIGISHWWKSAALKPFETIMVWPSFICGVFYRNNEFWMRRVGFTCFSSFSSAA